MTAVAFARSFLSGCGFPVPCRIRNASIFRNFEHNVANPSCRTKWRGRVMGVWSLVFGAMIPVGSLEAGAGRTFLGNAVRTRLWRNHCLIAAIITRVVIARREATAAT